MAESAEDASRERRPSPALQSSLAAIDAFIDALWLEDGLARLTLAAYRQDLTLYARWLDSAAARALDATTEADLLGHSVERHASSKATSSNRRLAVLRRYFRWALREGRCSADPTLRLSRARAPLRVPRSLSEAQVEALLHAPDVEAPLGLRDRTMLELMYASGLRVSELVGLKSVHLSLAEGALRITGKGSRERLVPFGEEARSWVVRYAQQGRGAILGERRSDFLFVTGRGAAMTRQGFWLIVKKHALKAGISVPCLLYTSPSPRD